MIDRMRGLRLQLLPLFCLLSFAAACGDRQPLGDANAIIVGTPDAVWSEVEGAVKAALEPRAFTVRDEQIFRVTQADPTSEPWGNLRRFRQILLIGEPGDPAIAEALDEVDEPLPSPPAVVRARDVWARDQLVTVALLPPAAGADAVLPLLPQLGERYLDEYQEYIRSRMFTSGVDSVGTDTLQGAGFLLLVPRVYQMGQLQPDVYLFRNENPIAGSQLIRSVLVTSRPSGEVTSEVESTLEWRDQVASRFYSFPQVRDTAFAVDSSLAEARGAAAVQVRGVWSTPPGEWPGGGPFITRLVGCPEQNRTYLLDAWLYAPGVDKYEYLLQLATILDTFACQPPGVT